MSYATLVETELYALRTCQRSNANVLVRKEDKHYAILDDMDTNLMSESIDWPGAFDTMASSFVYLNPLTEKSDVVTGT